jgi:septal ring factor EnvC (AmiA/AmiB activator)
MGEGGPQKPVLYFEIRRNGKPIDPLRFLSEIK